MQVYAPLNVAEELAVSFWGGESGFRLKALPSGAPEVFSVYPHNPYGCEKGGVEYERVLLRRPPSNVLRYSLKSWNLDFHHQTALSVADLELGRTRPEHVINSYAVYHPWKKNNQYKTGKACHIYRTWARDANGLQVWCDLQIGKRGIRQTLPGWFWESAKYPVTVDPSIGYTSLGASIDGTNAFCLANQHTASANGTTDAGTAYYGGAHATGATVYIAVYENGDGNISGNARLCFSSAITLSLTAAFRSAAITPIAFVSGTTYFIVNWANTSGVTTRYDNTGATNQYDATTSATPIDPFGTRDGTQTITPSGYIDFTEAAAAGGMVLHPGMDAMGLWKHPGYSGGFNA